MPYVYSPTFAQLLWPLVQLPLDAFLAVWVGLQLAAIGWLVTPLPAAVLVILVPAVGLNNVWAGALYLPMAVALVLSLRWPSLWAFQVLTKVTPGVGSLWHAGRREWRSFAIAVGSTLAIAAASALIWPAAWVEWLGLLADSAEMHGRSGTLAVPVPYRLPVAAAIVVLAGWRDWRWMLPVGVLLAMPQIGPSALVILLAIPRLTRSVSDAGQRL